MILHDKIFVYATELKVTMTLPIIVPVKQHSQMKNIIEYCEKQLSDRAFPGLSLVGEEKAVNKVISIAEILKNKHDLLMATLLEESTDSPNEPKLTITLSMKQ